MQRASAMPQYGAKVINVSIGGPDWSTRQRAAIHGDCQPGAFGSNSAGNDFEDGNPTIFRAMFALDQRAMSVAAIASRAARLLLEHRLIGSKSPQPARLHDGGGQDDRHLAASLVHTDQTHDSLPTFDNYATSQPGHVDGPPQSPTARSVSQADQPEASRIAHPRHRQGPGTPARTTTSLWLNPTAGRAARTRHHGIGAALHEC
jgi:hypothetical protein